MRFRKTNEIVKHPLDGKHMFDKGGNAPKKKTLSLKSLKSV